MVTKKYTYDDFMKDVSELLHLPKHTIRYQLESGDPTTIARVECVYEIPGLLMQEASGQYAALWKKLQLGCTTKGGKMDIQKLVRVGDAIKTISDELGFSVMKVIGALEEEFCISSGEADELETYCE